MANKCKDCGCTCKRCVTSDHDVQLHIEIENLKQKLVEKENHIVMMETNFLNETNQYPRGELSSIKEELITWQDKYKRLYEAHRRVQRVNQGLEDKLLKLVDVCETEKTALTKDVATLSHKLADANYSIKKLKEENERYKNDVSLAIQFLQCKQSNFVAHRYDTLPPEVQSQVSNYISAKRKPETPRPPPEIKSIKVPIPTFPPTAMVYSVPKSPNPERKAEPDPEQPVDIVSAAIMAKVLEERQRERLTVKHCDTCTCAKGVKLIYHINNHSIGTQTGEYKDMVCLRCNESLQNLTSMKIVRSAESKSDKIIPIYPLELQEPVIPPIQSNYNIVKVQPNNFLAEISAPASPAVSNKMSLKSHPIASNNVFNSEIKSCQTITTPDAQELQRSLKPQIKLESNCALSESQNRQRVADWIRNNMDENQDISISENSKSENIDRARYAEMEENVKRFLFGESEFLKTVEKGKIKYQNYEVKGDENAGLNNKI